MNVVKLHKKHRKTFTTFKRSRSRRRKGFLTRAQMAAVVLIALLIVGQHLGDDHPIALAVNPMFENPALATPVQVSKAPAAT